MFFLRGSSPLARGLPAATIYAASFKRIIPARAGFTPEADRLVVGEWDHPRSRGVYPLSSIGTRLKGGSSPLARGLRWVRGVRASR